MSNTKLRIMSTFVMLMIFASAVFLGQIGMNFLILICGILLVDELVHSMFGKERSHFSYIVSMVCFVCGFILLNFIDSTFEYYQYLVKTGVILNLVMLFFLFFEKMESKILIGFMQKYSFTMGLNFLVPLSAIGYIISLPNWLDLTILLILVNFLGDSGAWFFGKNFGKRKLWPMISPKKTIEGAVGGTITSVVISSIYISYSFGKLNFTIIIALFGLTIMAQLGDLLESKFKRQLAIKDSSELIPGHGGIYDRLDSLLFVAPFYAMMVMYLF